jgi:nitric oxide reductase NorE protein
MTDPAWAETTTQDPEGPATIKKELPGESGIWIIIFGDMMIFALFFATFLYYRSLDVDAYTASQAALNKGFGLLNTIILLTSSWFVVMAVKCVKMNAGAAAGRRLIAAALLGIGFWIVKVIEYRDKIAAGHTLITDEFFSFYFMYTGIHLVHVTAGLGALAYAYSLTSRAHISERDARVVEGVGAFWHLVDLLWIILFALLYLVS